MLVIVTEQQVLPTERVCSGCVMADNGGLPRWRKGKLGCGHLIEDRADKAFRGLPDDGMRDVSHIPCSAKQRATVFNGDIDYQLPQIYECQMGFYVTNIQ